MNERIVNLTQKSILEFTDKDTIYITKMRGGYKETFFCSFVSYYKGTVTGKIITTDSLFNRMCNEIDREVYAKLRNCYLWGKAELLERDYCHWFKKGGLVAC
jgi:hypothetical protein